MGDCLQSFGVLQGFAIMVTVLGLLLLLGALVEGLPQDWKRYKGQQAIKRRNDQYLADAREMTRLAEERRAEREKPGQ